MTVGCCIYFVHFPNINNLIRSELYAFISSSDVVQESVGVLTHERFGMVASDVVPHHAVLVDVVEEPEAGLLAAIDILLRVVRLGLLKVSGVGPGLVGPCGRGRVGGGDLFV